MTDQNKNAMDPFWVGSRECIKCGKNQPLKPTYCKALSCDNEELDREHLHKVCHECGYTVVTRTREEEKEGRLIATEGRFYGRKIYLSLYATDEEEFYLGAFNRYMEGRSF